MRTRSHWATLALTSFLLVSCGPSVTTAPPPPPRAPSEPVAAPPEPTPPADAAAEAPTPPVEAPPPETAEPIALEDLPWLDDEPLSPAVDTPGHTPSPSGGAAWGSAKPPRVRMGGTTVSGGGGKGEGIGLGSVGTLGHGAGSGTGSGFGSGAGKAVKGPKGSASGSAGLGLSGLGSGGGGSAVLGGVRASGARGARPPRPFNGVKSGEWDDNANFREFRKYLATQKSLRIESVDLSKRRFLVVRDQAGSGVPNCAVHVNDAAGHIARLTTTSSGRAILFPRAEGLTGSKLRATAQCAEGGASVDFPVADDDGAVALDLTAERQTSDRPTVDVVFILDTTGSMSEEIVAMQKTIEAVAVMLARDGVRLRIGLVEYRDRSDAYVARLHQMTTDIPGFITRVGTLRANGGGDRPEDVHEGLRVALDHINYRTESVARLAFLIGDAPPQLDYPNSQSYAQSMRRASERGIQVFTVAASGMDDLGQAIWRQVAQYTGGTNMFVLRGGAGPQSTGGGDPKSSCGGTHDNYASGNLHELVAGKVRSALGALERDPMRIPGLGQDENAKPCSARIVFAQ